MSKTIILLALHHQGNSRVLTDWLTYEYEVICSDLLEDIPDKVDLCILDHSQLHHSKASVIQYKKNQYPKFAPVLLITKQNNVSEDAKQLGTSIDELITTPIEKNVLQARIHGLIQTRSLTVNMLRLMEGSKSLLKSLQTRQFAIDKHAIVDISDEQGNIKYVNDKFCSLYGYRRDELLGKNHSLLNSGHHPQDFWAEMYRMLATGQPWSAEICNRAKDGRLYWVNTTIVPLLATDGQIQEYFTIQSDMTHIKQNEIQAQNANQAKGKFLANMSHEIRTPMNGVIGMLDVLQQTKLNSDQNRMVRTIRDSALSMLSLLNDILDFSKIEAGKMDIEYIPSQVREIVEDVAQVMISNACTKNIQLHTFVAPEIPAWVLSDPLRLKQILYNLLGNALKFTSSTEEAPGLVMLRVDFIEPTTGQKILRISVKDNGIGMSAETVNSLFIPFTQADETTTRRFGGTGLGLSITNRLVEMLNGHIQVHSVLDKGSDFIVELPISIAEPGIQSHIDVPTLANLTILVLTEHPIYTEILTAYLQAKFAQVIIAPDLEAGRQLLQKYENIDVVVLDPEYAEQDTSSMFEGCPSPVKLVQLIKRISSSDGSSNPDSHKIIVPTEPLLYSELLQGVAIAAGILSKPVESGDRRREPRISAPSVNEAKSMGQLILLADDNETNREVIQEQLRILGFASEAVEDGLEALLRWRTGDYALLLSDCHMPKMDGFQLTTAIRAEAKGTEFPIIAITADALQGEAERCIKNGMSDYLSKPVRLADLDNMLAKWLPRKQPIKELPIAPDPLERISKTTVWDANVLVKMIGGDMATQRRLLDKFLTCARDSVSELERAVQSGNPTLVADLAHKLKSPALTVGAMQLGELCAQLESAGRTGNLNTINILALRLGACFLDVAELINHG